MKINDANRERPSKGSLLRAKRWFVLTANRWLVAAILSVGVFGTIVLVGLYGPVPVRAFLGGGISPGAVLVELLKTIVSVVVIVLSINQLVLSPGLGPVGDQKDRYEDAMDLRRRFEDHTGESVSPTSPSQFFAVLAEAMLEQTGRLRSAAEDASSPSLRAEIEGYAENVERESRYLHDRLGQVELGEYGVVQALLRFAISEKVSSLRRLRKAHEASLSDDQREEFEEMEALLELFTISREYVKTIFIRSQYVSLSEGLLYVGLPAVVATYCSIRIYDPTVFPGSTLGVPNRLLFVSGAVTVALSPFVLLVSFVLRLAMLSRSTLFVGPFSAGDDSRTD